MIDLYSWPTPNGQKVQILLEELGCSYTAHPINILRGEQFATAFLAISPNNKIPAIVDRTNEDEPVSVFETGAILLYLAERFGRFLPHAHAKRSEVLEWLFFQSASLGPLLGQATHFNRYASEDVPYAKQRYTTEANRLYSVLEHRLEGRDWLAGEAYTIADIGAFPWICRARRQGVDINLYPRLQAWRMRISQRPAVARGMDVLKEVARNTPLDAQAHDTLFKG